MSDPDDTDDEVSGLATRPPGWDPDRPHEGVDIATLPDWWRTAIEEFERHGLRPYSPPRFEDGELVPEIVAELEDELGAIVRLTSDAASIGDPWLVRVDGEPVAEIGRRRDSGGYTRYLLSSEEFSRIVKSADRSD